MTAVLATTIGELEAYRPGLTRLCRRLLGSGFEAEDAVQETLLRAWRASGGFEGRSSVGSWLYRIATNVCRDMVVASQRRARPVNMPVSEAVGRAGNAGLAMRQLGDVADLAEAAEHRDPADVALDRESVRMAFGAALQTLPPRQRAVLILRDVLHWKAQEVGALLGMTVVGVNSSLQRARATLAAHDAERTTRSGTLHDGEHELLLPYVRAFEQGNVETLTALLQADAASGRHGTGRAPMMLSDERSPAQSRRSGR